MTEQTKRDGARALFPGADRWERYHDENARVVVEATPLEVESEAAEPAAERQDGVVESEGTAPAQETPPETSGELTRPLEGTVLPRELGAAGAKPPAKGSFGRLLQLLGFGKHRQRQALDAERVAAYEQIIRQTTWTRAVNIAVVSSKGGSGVEPAALTVGGLLGQVRGGSVGVVEASLWRSDLVDRAEGRPRRGLAELLAGARLVESAGNLAGYTAPQTSHAAVIGTVGSRKQLGPQDIVTARGVLDTYYQLTVSVLDSNLGASTTEAAIRSADAAVVPTTVSRLGLANAVRTVEHLVGVQPHLRGRVITVLGHSGAPEDPQTAAGAREWLTERIGHLAEVVEVPYEPAFIADTDFTLDHITATSRQAWLHVTAACVYAISDDHPVEF